jgi:ADP-heptose:LPS heptosyltransferase
MMKILVISMAGIGDTLFATPLIHELRLNYPTAKIDALVLWPGSKALLERNPHLNTVFQKNLIKAGVGASLRFLTHVRRNNYDLSINTHPQSRVHYRVVARFVGARLRASHNYDGGKLIDWALVNSTLEQDYQIHSVENNLNFLRRLGIKTLLKEHDYEIYLSEEESSIAKRFISSRGLENQVLLGIHVGSGGTKNLALRRWPLGSYKELINTVERVHSNVSVLLFGGPEEEKDHKELLALDPTRIFQPNTKTIREAAALLKLCHMFLSVDTALMHVAAAMKVSKQIVIETPTWNIPIQPFKNPFTLVRNAAVAGENLKYYKYNGKGIRGTNQEIANLMSSVSVDSVYKAVADALKELSETTPCNRIKT